MAKKVLKFCAKKNIEHMAKNTLTIIYPIMNTTLAFTASKKVIIE